MIALRARIGDMRAADLLYLFQKYRVGQDRQAQFLPILACAARNHIVNGRKAQFLMIKMPVNQGFWRLGFKPAYLPLAARASRDSIR